MRLTFDSSSLDDYRKFLAVRRCPVYQFSGSDAIVPDEYAAEIFGTARASHDNGAYEPAPFLFDYQRDISRLAIRKQKFAAFIECGLGKTLIMLEFAQHAWGALKRNRPVLIVSPLMVIPQTIAEASRFYSGLDIQQVPAAKLQDFLDKGSGFGITNYEALTQPLRAGKLGALLVDESSMLKSHYGKWGTQIVRLGAGLEWKLALTGTPAPNDRIEYANHAVFLGASRTINEFLARYFVNRGQTDNRWELKPHALGPFYRDLSHWCIFLSNPAVYGWKDNAESIPPIKVHIEQVGLTAQQLKLAQQYSGGLMVSDAGGIGSRSKLGQLAKGYHNGERVETLKCTYIRERVDSWPEESTLIWCLYNDEQNQLSQVFPEAANISGDTPLEERLELIDAFKSGQRQVMISKGKLLGFGLNLQRATRQVFSGLQDSYETFHQCVKRSNRIGSRLPLNVHIPVTEIEEPMVQTVLQKAHRVQQDTEEQEKTFKERAWLSF